MEYIGEHLDCRVVPLQFKGDIYLSKAERERPSPIFEEFETNEPYWIIVAGGKSDYTIKWWNPVRFQEVVDHFRGKIQFVQVGASDDFHPQLTGVLDLRGKTSLRDLVRLVYRSSGVLCPVTFLMHLSAAVECPPNYPQSRPCVVVAGGREAPHWVAYPTHQFIHTVGALDCCREGGCWRSRTRPLGDRDVKDLPRHLCLDVVGTHPRCMDMITSKAVIERIEYYLH
jgi:ADP-heptose:LPS heptosyltransferase